VRPVPAGAASARATLALAALAVLVALAATLLPPASTSSRDTGSGPRLELGPGPDLAGFARATAVRPFVLPLDHGPHFEFQTEWWYYTGNLAAADGRRFGFQLTFFRRGLSPGPPPDGPGLASNQVYFAHLAITDVSAGRHVAAERFSRGAAGLAGATSAPFAVWLEDWKASGASSTAAADPTSRDGRDVRLVARDASSGISLDLELRSRKPLVAHGNRGLSAKSEEPGNASYYVGYTRLSASGRLASPDVASGSARGEVAVTGEAWFDHEWSTSALGRGAVGWDWFSLQLDDAREVMYFQLRREDGGIEAVSGGTLVDPDGRTRRLARDDVRIEVLRRWRSPETGATYPSRWRLAVPSEGLDLLIEPRVESQEMRTSFLYWEGAVHVSGPATGQGYVELTGYAGSMQGVF
jgi:predicted secreted hydrolase